jgi:hypothetical protein
MDGAPLQDAEAMTPFADPLHARAATLARQGRR